MNANRIFPASVGYDVLDNEIGIYEMKQMLKVVKEVLRKNHYKHMH